MKAYLDGAFGAYARQSFLKMAHIYEQHHVQRHVQRHVQHVSHSTCNLSSKPVREASNQLHVACPVELSARGGAQGCGAEAWLSVVAD